MDKNNRKLKLLYIYLYLYIYIYIERERERERDRYIYNIIYIYICTKVNTSAIWQHMLHIPPQLKYSSPNRSKKQRATKNSLSFRKWRFRAGKSQENGQNAEQEKTERATGLGRRTKEEVYQSVIKLTALRVQTGGRHQKFPASLQR